MTKNHSAIMLSSRFLLLWLLSKSNGFSLERKFHLDSSLQASVTEAESPTPHPPMISLADCRSNLEVEQTGWNRRKVFVSLASLSSGFVLLSSQASFAQDSSSVITNYDTRALALDCLKDLPAFDPATTVRLYLCRHGQTENNRLQLMQGARVDTSLNDTGKRQAAALGLALSGASIPPEQILYSPLQRAQQTALLASNQFSVVPTGHTLPSLAELDFGDTAESEPVESVRAEMVATYTAWAMGDLDARMAGGGETGREMLLRIDNALQSLVETASETKTGCIAAVSHSAYLRMLLATVGDMSLLKASKLKLENCCVNVLDFPRPSAISKDAATHLVGTRQVPIPGGPVSRLTSDLQLQTPKGRVIRMNEKRHLQSIVS